MCKFIDIHTHKLVENKNIISIYNTFLYKENLKKKNQSIGLHPWHLEETNIEEEIVRIEKNITNERVIAIGECGLDKLCKTNFMLQIEILKRQIKIAEKVSKPVIIHCVKSYNEILQIRKKTNLNIPWIIHDFNENQEITKKLIDKNIYISIGKKINNQQTKVYKNLQDFNLDYIFLETDDSEYLIEDIYLRVSEKLNLKKQKLVEIICNNFLRVFKNETLSKSEF